MSVTKDLVYVAFWKEDLQKMVTFLKANNYDQAETHNLEIIAFRKENENVQG